MTKLLKISLLIWAMHIYAQTAPAQTWFPITTENSNVSVTLPAGATYRFGIANCPATGSPAWAQVTVTANTTINPVSMAAGNPFPFADPCPYHTKELDVLEGAAAQAVVYTDVTATPLNIGIVIPPAAGPPAIPSGQHVVLIDNFSDQGGQTSALILMNQPANGATISWVGTQFRLSIDGVTMMCTYGQTYISGVFTLSCSTT